MPIRLFITLYMAGLGLLPLALRAQILVHLPFTDAEGKTGNVEAVLRQPVAQSNGKALLILHHAGGWGMGTTQQYAEYFSARGFVTLEPRMFNTRPKHVGEYLGHVFGGLKFLAAQSGVDPTQISLMGLSFGANLTVMSATEWAHRQYGDGQHKFKSHAAFYPVCWAFTSTIRRTLPGSRMSKFPADFLDRWVGVPLTLFAGTQDDYENRDPQSCPEFAAAIPDEKQKTLTRVNLYEGATHGWDQTSVRFFEPVGCKGKGCFNTNTQNPEVTARAKKDLLKFLNE